MHPCDTPSAQLPEGLDRQQSAQSVARHGADAYDKRFSSWDHLLALIFAQLSPASSLRGLEVAWNAHAAADPHLGTGPLHRSTLSDANQRRPLAVFTETFIPLEPGTTSVFDKGYCHHGWWSAIAEAGAMVATRPKTNMRLRCAPAVPCRPSPSGRATASRCWPATRSSSPARATRASAWACARSSCAATRAGHA